MGDNCIIVIDIIVSGCQWEVRGLFSVYLFKVREWCKIISFPQADVIHFDIQQDRTEGTDGLLRIASLRANPKLNKCICNGRK